MFPFKLAYTHVITPPSIEHFLESQTDVRMIHYRQSVSERMLAGVLQIPSIQFAVRRFAAPRNLWMKLDLKKQFEPFCFMVYVQMMLMWLCHSKCPQSIARKSFCRGQHRLIAVVIRPSHQGLAELVVWSSCETLVRRILEKLKHESNRG